jgi:hypothetical protein
LMLHESSNSVLTETCTISSFNTSFNIFYFESCDESI